MDIRINSRIGWNAVEAGWVHSTLPNGGNGRQNDLRVSTGISLRFSR
jgi:hypothetical protein